jgi:MscS family membrane protein
MNQFLEYKILDNPIENILWLLLVVLIAFIFKRFISKILGSLMYQAFRRYSVEDKGKVFSSLILAPAQLVLLLVTISIGLGFLEYPSRWNYKILDKHLRDILIMILRLANTIAITWLVLRIVDFITILLKERAEKTESKLDDQLVPFIKDAIKVVIVVLALFFILGAIFKFNIASLIAGVGIGGLAIALAAQESLKNLFASITIFLDKPFTVGDLVTINGVTGTIENVGFRSTRLRTAEKTFVTLPNNMMVSSHVDNLTLRTYRRVIINITLSYDTPLNSIKKIVEDINIYIHSFPELNEENTVRFNELTDNGFQINIVYFIPQQQFTTYMEFKEQVNFKVVEIVQSYSAEFAKTVRVIETKNKN